MMHVIPTKEGTSVASLFEYCFISFSDSTISHECINFRTEDPVGLEVMGGGNDCRCFSVGGA